MMVDDPDLQKLVERYGYANIPKWEWDEHDAKLAAAQARLRHLHKKRVSALKKEEVQDT
jgi:hypothetical protein